MIYVPVDVNSPIQVSKHITVMGGLTNNFPEIVFELHDGKKYYDFKHNCIVTAVVENPDLGICLFTGKLEIMNPHRGQILCVPVFRDFSMTGLNTLTVMCYIDDVRIAFKTTIFVQSSFVGLQKKAEDENTESVAFMITVRPEDFVDNEYLIQNAAIKYDSEVHITVPNNISTDEYDALAFANIVPEEQTNGKIRLKVLGKIPSIPIRLLVSVRTSV
jgi:hypothetical protein